MNYKSLIMSLSIGMVAASAIAFAMHNSSVPKRRSIEDFVSPEVLSTPSDILSNPVLDPLSNALPESIVALYALDGIYNKDWMASRDSLDKIFNEYVLFDVSSKRCVYVKNRMGTIFHASFAFVPGRKTHEGDGKNIFGLYYICAKVDGSSWKYFMQLSYPNNDDALRGLKSGIITTEQYAAIQYANTHGFMPPQNTRLGKHIGVHAGNTYFDIEGDYSSKKHINWTNGCIGLDDAGAEFLWKTVKIGTPVIIEL